MLLFFLFSGHYWLIQLRRSGAVPVNCCLYLISANNVLKINTMKTKSFVLKLNQITTTLLFITPAQREVVHQSIRVSQVEMLLARLKKCHLREQYARKNCDHKRLINLKNRVIDNINHIKTGNGSITHFKSWIMGNMKGIATQYLPHYLAWFRESHTQYDYQQTLAAAYN